MISLAFYYLSLIEEKRSIAIYLVEYKSQWCLYLSSALQTKVIHACIHRLMPMVTTDLSDVPYSGKVWRIDSVRTFDERNFGELIDRPIDYLL